MGVALGGCASFKGAADPILTSKESVANAETYKEPDALAAFASPKDSDRKNLDAKSYRDMVAGLYMSAADARYRVFRKRLSEEYHGANAGSAVAVLVMNGVAVVSGQEAARALAAGSVVVGGANGAVNKELFYEKTLQAILAAMDANRDAVKVRIRTSLQQLSATDYTMVDVFSDIRDLEAQASVDAALQQITATAITQAADQKQKLQATYKSPILSAPVLTERKAFTAYIDTTRASGANADIQMIHDIAKALGATDDPASAPNTGANIKVWMDQHVQSQKDYDAVVAKLKDITRKDSY